MVVVSRQKGDYEGVVRFFVLAPKVPKPRAAKPPKPGPPLGDFFFRKQFYKGKFL